MQKTYILDTNVLIHDPEAIYNFQDNTVVIPYPVIEELDGLKKAYNGKSHAARRAIRQIEKLLPAAKKEITSYYFSTYSIELSSGGKLIITGKANLTKGYTSIDNLILDYILIIKNALSEQLPEPVVFVTKDVSLRIKAKLLDIQAEDYRIKSQESYGF